MVAIADTRTPGATEQTTGTAGLWTVAFLGVTAGVQMSDRGLQSILSPAIKARFGVSDAVIGATGGLAIAVQVVAPMIALFLALTSTANALIPTILQDIIPAELRARSFAIYSFVIAAFCAIGPLLTGGLSDRAVGGNLLLAMSIAGAPALLVAAICAGLMTRERSA